jgi:hypothetical protein
MIGGYRKGVRGVQSWILVSVSTIRTEFAAESPAKTAVPNSVVSSRARASSLVTNGLERPTAPIHASGMEWRSGSVPEWPAA